MTNKDQKDEKKSFSLWELKAIKNWNLEADE